MLDILALYIYCYCYRSCRFILWQTHDPQEGSTMHCAKGPITGTSLLGVGASWRRHKDWLR